MYKNPIQNQGSIKKRKLNTLEQKCVFFHFEKEKKKVLMKCF